MNDANFRRVLYEAISDLYKEKEDKRGRFELSKRATFEFPRGEWAWMLVAKAYEDEDDMDRARQIYREKESWA